MDLTKSQDEAVNHFRGPALVIAGPGAGKTFVMTERVKKLISDRGVDPKKILVTTFTNKAADELKVKLARTVGKSAELIHISTIHSFCQSMLDEFSNFHRLGASFSVLDEENQFIFIKSKYAFEFDLKEFIKPYEVSALINVFNKSRKLIRFYEFF